MGILDGIVEWNAEQVMIMNAWCLRLFTSMVGALSQTRSHYEKSRKEWR